MSKRISVLANACVMLSLVIPWTLLRPGQAAALLALPVGETGIYRARVALTSTAARDRLDKLGIKVLASGADWASVLVTGSQLATLVQLHYTPGKEDELGLLVTGNSVTASAFGASLRPLLDQAAAVAGGVSPAVLAAGQVNQAVQTSLATVIHTFAIDQLNGINSLSSIDSDGDGLTNTQESWWCTDPTNPYTREDPAKTGKGVHNDGDYVARLLQYLYHPELGDTRLGAPFAGWPMVPGDGHYNPNCLDADYDGVPDLAEMYVIGSNPNAESTAHDRYDDGQKLFGITPANWGVLPRAADGQYASLNLPGYVQWPGRSLFAAAIAQPKISVVDSSLHVAAVTTVTTDHTITSGTEKSYSTSSTEGTSTSVSNSETWNNWQEISTTNPNISFPTQIQFSSKVSGWLHIGADVLGVAGAVGGAITACTTVVLCILGVAGAVGATTALVADINDHWDDLQNLDNQNKCSPTCPAQGIKQPNNQQFVSEQANSVANGDLARGGAGTNISLTNSSQINVTPQYQLTVPKPISTKTQSQGSSYGGSLTTTTSQYEEQTVTNGQAFSSSEGWSTATAVDSAHAADLWFTYTVANTGTDFANQIGNLTFNIYIGDDPNPVYTYYASTEIGGDGLLHNFMPGEAHTYTSHHIPLNLDQMRSIDLGKPVRVVLEDYSFGADEQFYEDAANTDLQIAVDDGIDDGDQTLDNYLLPTWGGSETVLDVLARYFPNTVDANGALTALWTPEYRSGTPTWCQEPRVVTAGGQRAVWCKHALSAYDWWNIYTSGMGDGSTGLQDSAALPGATALFRINKDSDRDGYSDASEVQAGTDPHNPADFPHPVLLAGVNNIQSGSQVVATLSLLNQGNYDAYGVEAVMVAPDDSITITNNTVGGSGRVGAQKTVVVGSSIQPPSYTAFGWTGTALPASGGYFTGGADNTYVFTVNCSMPGGCDVGNGTWTLGWVDSVGSNGTLNFSSGYASPNLVDVGTLGVKIALQTGKVYNGDSFTVKAQTPRDTFQYTINRTPYTPPLVVVSYNDPQGNHRFIIPPAAMTLARPTDALAGFIGKMLPDPSVAVTTSASFTPGANTTSLVVNNPSGTALTNAKLYLDFIDPSGAVVDEVSVTQTLTGGPVSVPMSWNTSAFNPAYNSNQDYIVMAFWTDNEGNIIATGGRPLSSFQADPLPGAVMPVTSWNFGSVPQGMPVSQAFTLANKGYTPFYYGFDQLGSGLSSTNPAGSVSPATFAAINLTLDTLGLPVGPYSRTVALRTSDPAAPSFSIHMSGTIVSTTDTAFASPVSSDQPWDWYVSVPGSHNAGEPVSFQVPALGGQAEVQPLYLYDQSQHTIYGHNPAMDVLTLDTNAVPSLFGDGRDGDLDVPAGQTMAICQTRTSVNASGATVHVGSSVGFSAGDLVLFHQTQGANAGYYESNIIQSIDSGTNNWQLTYPLGYAYNSNTGSDKAQVIRIPQYTSVTIENGAKLTAPAWDGATGGLIVMRISGQFNILTNGQVTTSGYRGGWPQSSESQGESYDGVSSVPSTSPNGQGGGGGYGLYIDAGSYYYFGGGGGGGNATSGNSGISGATYCCTGTPGTGGYALEGGSRNVLYFGGGGGGGGMGGAGGAGGGLVIISASATINDGFITANGQPGADHPGGWGGGGGGGAGGDVYLVTINYSSQNGSILSQGAQGGNGNPAGNGGSGGNGTIYVDISNHGSIPITNPSSDINRFSWSILQANEGIGSILLPEAQIAQKTYWAQYGEYWNFTSSGVHLFHIRLSKRVYQTLSLDTLFSHLAGLTSPSFTLDIGADGTIDWSEPDITTQTSKLSSPNLAAALNAYLAGQTPDADGTVLIPIRVHLNGTGQVYLTNLVATPFQGELQIASSDLSASKTPANETDVINLSAVVHNTSTDPAANVLVSFFAGDPAAGGTYIGSDFLAAIAAGQSQTARLTWNTTGFSGSLPVYAVADVANEQRESDKTNNKAVITLTILSRPDLTGTISLSDPEPLAGEPVVVTLNETNGGQTSAAASQAALYNGDPASGGTAIDTVQSVPAIGGIASAPVTFNWTPPAPGWYRLYAVSDIHHAVNESNTANNTAWLDVHVGLASPVTIDSGLAAGDPAYTPALSYGYVDPQGNDVRVKCGTGTQPENTLRRDPGGDVTYRFDNLVPAHFYHLDLLLYECDGAGRQETVNIDGNSVAGPEDLGNGLVHRLSILVDPALYQDRSLQVDIQSTSVDGAVVAAVNLTDVDYRYFDSGAAGDVAFPGSHNAGYLDANSTPSTAWGVLPYQSLRVNQNASTLTYRFAGLNPAKVYNLHLTFWQKDGAARLQTVAIDGSDTNLLVNTGDYQVHQETVLLPKAAYQVDGTIDVVISRIGATSGASVNEIALEEQTLATAPSSGVVPTPYFTDVYGGVQVNVDANGQGTPAPLGTVINALDPRGDVVGSFTVTTAGQYGYMHLYGEDASADPPVPGMRDGELVTFTINGAPAVAKPSFYWHSDFMVHPVDLSVGTTTGQQILLQPGWNFISFYVEPPSPLLNNVLQSVFNRYDRVLSETGVYDIHLADAFNTLSELHSGQGYLLRLTGTATGSLVTNGLAQAASTPVALHAGWNWIGYLPRASQPISQALGSISGKYQFVHTLFLTYNPSDPVHSTLATMDPGQGYLIYMTSAATLVYPAGGSSAPTVQNQPQACAGVAPTPEMMVIYGSVTLNGAPAPSGSRLEVLTPRGEVAGCAIVQDAGVLKYTHVFGSDGSGPGFLPGESLVFKLNGKEVQADAALVWQNNPTGQPVALNGHGDYFNGFLPFITK